MLNSTRNLFNARRNLAEARYGYIRQRLALEQAVGDLTPEDLQGINAALSEQADGTTLPTKSTRSDSDKGIVEVHRFTVFFVFMLLCAKIRNADKRPAP